MAGDEVADLRVDLLAPAAPAEDAVMAGTGDGELPVVLPRDAGGERMRGVGKLHGLFAKHLLVKSAQYA